MPAAQIGQSAYPPAHGAEPFPRARGQMCQPPPRAGPDGAIPHGGSPASYCNSLPLGWLGRSRLAPPGRSGFAIMMRYVTAIMVRPVAGPYEHDMALQRGRAETGDVPRTGPAPARHRSARAYARARAGARGHRAPAGEQHGPRTRAGIASLEPYVQGARSRRSPRWRAPRQPFGIIVHNGCRGVSRPLAARASQGRRPHRLPGRV